GLVCPSVRNPHIQDDTFNFTRCKGLYPLFKGGLHLCGNVEALKIGGKGFGVLWIFLNDQYLFGTIAQGRIYFGENLLEALVLERFPDKIDGAPAYAIAFLGLFGRHHVDWDMTGIRIGLQTFENLPPVHMGQDDVQQDSLRRKPQGSFHGQVTPADSYCLIASFSCILQYQSGESFIVLHYQDRLVPRNNGPSVIWNKLRDKDTRTNYRIL